MPGWDGADVVGVLSGLLHVPVVADNDVNLMALGEHKAAWQDVSHLLFVKVATGIGAGFVDRGRVSRGAHGAAGDIGHIPVAGSRTPCPCGNVGCLEVNASGSALAAQLRQQGYDVSGSDGVVALVRTGNVAAAQAVRQAGRDIGDILAACVSMVNPNMIVIGGSLSEAGEHLLAGIREVVYSRSLPLASRDLRVVATQTKGHAGILGASSLAADLILRPSAVDQLVNALPASASSA
jgi:predicted NBD/HSP70 family sugar kinase